jgi:L-alanine-DL-glutamate epimerase-like enolase superfamily enzyme
VINATGHKGITISALSAIDVVCWDANGRTLDQPLHQLFGSCRTWVDTYTSVGLWLGASIDDLQAAPDRAVDNSENITAECDQRSSYPLAACIAGASHSRFIDAHFCSFVCS